MDCIAGASMSKSVLAAWSCRVESHNCVGASLTVAMALSCQIAVRAYS